MKDFLELILFHEASIFIPLFDNVSLYIYNFFVSHTYAHTGKSIQLCTINKTSRQWQIFLVA